VRVISDVKIEYSSEIPKRAYWQGGSLVLPISKLIADTFLFDKRYFYPIGAIHNDEVKIIGYFDKKPAYFEGRPYKIYRIRRNGSTSVYLPLPYKLKSFLGNDKRPLLKYSFGFVQEGLIIIIEKWKDGNRNGGLTSHR